VEYTIENIKLDIIDDNHCIRFSLISENKRIDNLLEWYAIDEDNDCHLELTDSHLETNQMHLLEEFFGKDEKRMYELGDLQKALQKILDTHE
jgi:hypothetical protein